MDSMSWKDDLPDRQKPITWGLCHSMLSPSTILCAKMWSNGSSSLYSDLFWTAIVVFLFCLFCVCLSGMWSPGEPRAMSTLFKFLAQWPWKKTVKLKMCWWNGVASAWVHSEESDSWHWEKWTVCGTHMWSVHQAALINSRIGLQLCNIIFYGRNAALPQNQNIILLD